MVVAGTAGDVSMHSLQVAQWSEATWRGMVWRLGYIYRRDVTEFHSTERIITRSLPASETRTPINTHETTISEVQEIPIGVSRQVEMAPRWRLTGFADVSPLANGKLTTILPEKYPGQEIVFHAKVAAIVARVELDWQRPRWPLTLSMSYGRTWSYDASNTLSRDSWQGGVRLGLRR